jgi:hypothetical protein
MDQGCGLDGLICRFTGNLTVSNGTELVVDDGHEATEGFPVAITP